MTQNQYSVGDITAVLIFSGTGKIQIHSNNQYQIYIGDSSVTAGTGTMVYSAPGLHLEFSCPTDVYGIAPTGTTSDVRVLHWY